MRGRWAALLQGATSLCSSARVESSVNSSKRLRFNKERGRTSHWPSVSLRKRREALNDKRRFASTGAVYRANKHQNAFPATNGATENPMENNAAKGLGEDLGTRKKPGPEHFAMWILCLGLFRGAPGRRSTYTNWDADLVYPDAATPSFTLLRHKKRI